MTENDWEGRSEEIRAGAFVMTRHAREKRWAVFDGGKCVESGLTSQAHCETWLASRLGRAAFERGIIRLPAQDSALMGVCTSPDVSMPARTRFLRSWLHGWDSANLAAPVTA